MIACVINAVLVLLGSAVGLLFKRNIKESWSKAIMTALGLCVLLIGVSGAVKTQNVLCVILSMVFGTILGELLRIEDRLDALGDLLKRRLMKGRESGRFTEGFMTASLMFCVGSMAIVGSMEAGISHNYSTILSKSALDCVTAVTLSAAMGVGVAFSAAAVLVYQGLLTLLFIFIGDFLPGATVTEMSATGSLLIIALGLNMLGVTGERRIRAGNMLPAVFLPIALLPLMQWVGRLLQLS
jgi:uncharacterized membrane protein YqgA involved in biofilm formation